MAVIENNAIGIFGKKGDPAYSFFAEALTEVSEVTYVDEHSDISNIKQLVLPITFPFPNKSMLDRFKLIPKVGVVFDGLAVDVMLEVILDCEKVVCFNSNIKNKLESKEIESL